MSDCRFGVSPVNYPDPDPDELCPNFKKIRDDDKFNYLLNSDGPIVKVVLDAFIWHF